MLRTAAIASLGALLLALAPRTALAVWPDSGLALTSDGWDEAVPVLAPTGDGGVIVAWQEFARIYAQSVTGKGEIAAGWPAAWGLEVSPLAPQGPFHQCAPRIASDGSGGAFILWHDGRNSGCYYSCVEEKRELYLEHITATGNFAPGWPASAIPIGSSFGRMLFSSGTGRVRPDVFNTVMIPDASGGTIIAWQELPIFSKDSLPAIRAQRVSAVGRLLWGPRGASVCFAGGGHWFPVLWSDGSGGACVAWEEHAADGSPARIWGQHISGTGQVLWGSAGRPLASSAAGHYDHQVAPDRGGAATLVWSGTVGDTTSLYARRVFSDDRHPWGPEQVVATNLSRQPQPQVIGEARGGAWVAWFAPADSGKVGVSVRQVGAIEFGMPAWSSKAASLAGAVSGEKSALRIAPDGHGGAILGWLEGRFAPRASHVLASGALDPNWPLAGRHLEDPMSGSYQLEMLSDGRDGAFIAWERQRDFPSPYDMVRLQRLWGGGIGEDQPWPPVSGDTAIGTGSWMRLQGFTRNPARGAAEVAFTLSRSGPAVLQLFDTSGRCLIAREVGSLGIGEHVVRLAGKGRLSPGVYFVRLRSSGRSLSARGVVIE